MRLTYVSVFCCLAVPFAVQADPLEEIKVTAHPLASNGVAQDTIVIAGEALAEKVQGSLGETVAGEVGIQSASFGVAVGRPVIHGLGGPRVKTTEDRIDSLDVSVTSTDHAVTVEPFIADRINILKGASTLLYGSGAIGGVVDVETGRIPKAHPEATQGRIELRGTDNGNATVAAGRVDGSIGEFAWHLDAFDRQSDDYDIPDFVESLAQRESEAEEEGEEGEEEERGQLDGSFSENSGGAIGFSHIGDYGFAGISISTIDAQYGLVGGHEEEEEGEEAEEESGEEEAPGMIDLQQTRIDLEAQWNRPDGFIQSINFRAGINDYEHQEIEGNGEVGSLFDNQAWEARLAAVHAPIAEFNGTVGVQINARDFSAIGEEAFVPPVESDSVGLFWLGERQFNDVDLELGARVERVSHQLVEGGGASSDFTAVSASMGLVWSATNEWTLAGLLDFSSRAPSVEELFSNGPHLATQSFEVGDPLLDEESATSLTLTADYRSDSFDAKITAYHLVFDDFIYQLATGDVEDGLPVFNYQQQDAQFTGLDAELAWHLGSVADGDFDLEFQFDTVTAKLDRGSNRNLPRIPSARAGVEASWKSDAWHAKLGVVRVSSQTDTAVFELPTQAYNDISFYLSRSWNVASSPAGRAPLTFFIHGRNLGDDEQRHHTSFVKDFAPAPGRRIEVGARFSF